MKKKKILITGTAGFIGFHLSKKLIDEDWEIIGLDNINDYYDINLKYARLGEVGIYRKSINYGEITQSSIYPNYSFIKVDLEDRALIEDLFAKERFNVVIHLAAQAGVRFSVENPHVYISSNLVGYVNILECCRHNKIEHFIYASSSSVYGNTQKVPFSESDNVDLPVSLYAATKKANELMAHVYSHSYQLPTTGLRFFTVYGPWGRPDMAPMIFTKSIMENQPIKVYNYGNMMRDFTYIDDIIDGIYKVIKNNPPYPSYYYKIYNIGNSDPIKLLDFINTIELNIGKKAILKMLPKHNEDVCITYADVRSINKDVNYLPYTKIESGIAKFISWYKEFYNA